MEHFCKHNGCEIVAIFGFENERNVKCDTHKDDGMVRTFTEDDYAKIPLFDLTKKSRICIFKTCPTQATCNFGGEYRRLFCASHKLETMYNVGSKKCCVCHKAQPIFNTPNQTIGTHCGKCKLTCMVDVQNKKCFCGKHLPIFAKQGEKATHCAECKENEMVDVKNKKCFCGKRQATFNHPTESKGSHCSKCKLEGMIDVVNKKCVVCKVTRPSFNEPTEYIPTHCVDCKLNTMVNNTTKQCCVCDSRQPSFNFPEEEIATHCGYCKENGMVNIKDKMCAVCNQTRPSYNMPGETIPTHCLNCKLDGMVNVKSPICIECNISQAQRQKFRGYCLYCFIHKFPDEEITRNYKVKEKHVMDFIKSKFHNIDLVFDKRVIDGCSRRRPDIFIDYGSYVIVIECDENKHCGYSCENKRTMEIFQDCGNRPLVVIRFNPDGYTKQNGTNEKSCFKICKRTSILVVDDRKKWQERLNTLKEKTEYYLEHMPEKELTIEYLFYDGYV